MAYNVVKIKYLVKVDKTKFIINKWACAKRWSGVVEWSGVLETPNWSGVLIEHMNRGVYLQWVPLCPAVPEVAQSHVVT